VVFRWLEVEGPIYDQWPPVGHKLLFADLPMVTLEVKRVEEDDSSRTNRFGQRRFRPPPGIDVVSKKPMADAERLLREFMKHAYRRPTDESDLKRFLPVVRSAIAKG
jgi:hypothetical protein